MTLSKTNARQLQASLEGFRSGRADMSREDLEAVSRQFELTFQRVTRRLNQAEAEVVDLETRLTQKRDDLDAWQELLDRRLGGV